VGDKHVFILNGNKYSFQLIRKTTQLEAKLLATLLIRPANSLTLRRVILKRHKIGGAEIYHHHDLVEKSSTIGRVIERIHEQSKGNIGAALHLWLASIDRNDQGELYIDYKGAKQFPNITNRNWKLLLYHFILHRKLSEGELQEIVNEEAVWIKSTLLEMQKAGLVFRQPDGNYELNSTARFDIENWLKTLSFIN
jgi:hypothetical protein